jgi:O-antigen/teichoic acid export membrane protein
MQIALTKADPYFSSDHLRRDLKGKTIRGGVDLATAQALMVLIALASIPVLTRLLAPADFGLVAMVAVFTGLAAMFVDAGLAMATIQAESLTHQQASNLFWVATALGLLIALAVCALAPAIALFYGEPRLVGIAIGLSAATLLSGLTIQHQALLRRALQLRRLAIVQVTATLLGNLVAIALAWTFRSYWALVALPVTVAALRMAGAWLACPWRPGAPRRGANVRPMIGFGAHLTGFSFINYFARSGDNMLIGWSWGDTALGFYERAYKLMMAPLQQISAPLTGIVVPALSRLHHEPALYRTAYFGAVSVLQVVSVPLMAFVAVMAPSVVRVIFGPGFEEAASILRWLAIAGLFQPLTHSFGWLYISQGRGRELMRWGMLSCSLIIASFLLGLPWGPRGVAAGYALMITLVIAPLAVWFAGTQGAVRRGDLVRAAGIALLYAAPSAASSMVVAFALHTDSAILSLAAAATASAAATLALLNFTAHGRELLAQARTIARQRKGVSHG